MYAAGLPVSGFAKGCAGTSGERGTFYNRAHAPFPRKKLLPSIDLDKRGRSLRAFAGCQGFREAYRQARQDLSRP